MLVASVESAQAVVLPLALLAVSAREFLAPALQGTVHLLTLLVARAAAPRLTARALSGLAGALIVGGAAFFLNELVGPRGVCAGCDARGWANVALLASGYGAAALALALPRPERPFSPVALPLLLCLAVPFVQIGLLLAMPKLCFACVTAGVASVFAVAAARDRTEDRPVRRAFGGVAAAVAALVFVGGFVSRPTAKDAPLRSLRDLPAAAVGLSGTGDARQVVLLTLPGCHYCEGARKRLAERGIPFREESVQGGRFAGGRVDQSFAPQLLVIEHGIVVDHVLGLDVPAYDRLGRKP